MELSAKIILIILLSAIALFGILLLFIRIVSKRPSNLGIIDGKLNECGEYPNCVCTDSQKESHKIDYLPFKPEIENQKEYLKSVIAKIPRTKLIVEKENYLYYEFRSLAWRFIDDVEFYFNENTKQIHMRSASRIGTNDFGANRNRIENIRKLYEN